MTIHKFYVDVVPNKIIKFPKKFPFHDIQKVDFPFLQRYKENPNLNVIRYFKIYFKNIFIVHSEKVDFPILKHFSIL